MQYITTGNPTAKTEGDRIVVTFPSGKDKAEFPLTLDQAFMLEQLVRQRCLEAMRDGFAKPPHEGEIIILATEQKQRKLSCA